MVRIPSEYQEVEYIESTGTQWIDLDMQITNDMSILATVLLKSGVPGNINIACFGGRTSGTENNVQFNKSTTGVFVFDYGSYTTNRITFPLLQDTFFDINFSNNIITVNGASKEIESVAPFATPKTYLFDCYNKYSGWGWVGRIAKFDIEGVRHCIPCYRKSDNEIGMYDTVTKTFFTNQGTGTFLKGNDVTYDTVNLLESRRRILLNTPHLESASGSVVSFNTDMATNLKECKVHFSPVQEGEGTPSPDNVRPISGWDGVTVTRCGKNISLPFYAAITGNGLTITADNDNIIINGTARSNGYTNFHARFHPEIDGRYKVGGAVGNSQHYLFLWDATRQTYAAIIYETEKIVDLEASHEYFFAFYALQGQTFTNYRCNPYVYLEDDYSQTNITFPKTIYGGYVDPINGEVIEEWEGITSYNNESIAEPWMSDKDAYSQNTLPSLGSQVVYKLADSNLYTITPQTIESLKGLNNIWDNTNGILEVKFWTH